MFNVSALLLDDALKLATPLTNGVINETLRQTLDISQGSVATHLRCGGIFTLVIVLLPIFCWFWQLNNFGNQLIFDEGKAYKNGVHFWATLYMGFSCVEVL